MQVVVPLATALLHDLCHLIDAITPPFQIMRSPGPLTTNSFAHPHPAGGSPYPCLTDVQALAGSFLTGRYPALTHPTYLKGKVWFAVAVTTRGGMVPRLLKQGGSG